MTGHKVARDFATMHPAMLQVCVNTVHLIFDDIMHPLLLRLLRLRPLRPPPRRLQENKRLLISVPTIERTLLYLLLLILPRRLRAFPPRHRLPRLLLPPPPPLRPPRPRIPLRFLPSSLFLLHRLCPTQKINTINKHFEIRSYRGVFLYPSRVKVCISQFLFSLN